LGGIIGSNIYLVREKPHYRTGYAISLGFIGIALLSVVANYTYLSAMNKKRERYINENGGADGVVEKHGDVTLTEMGDRSFLFKYTL
jgi:type II secretory pathway component PulC